MLGWGNIARLCLVNAAIGGMAALPVNLFNRLMTVELALPALLPGLLVALHYAVQLTRPVWGHRSDTAGRRTPVILWGMGVLGFGTVAAAWAVSLPTPAALAVWVIAYTVIGLGIGAAGTSFLALLATAAPDTKRGAAATLAWLMLIAGAIAASIGTGIALEPYSPQRLTLVVITVAAIAWLLSAIATVGIERRAPTVAPSRPQPLRAALAETWADPAARRFTGFVFLSILAFYLSELIFEPFAGHVHGLPPEASTKLSGAKDGAALLGMIAAGALATLRMGDLRMWAVTGCVVSALGLLALGAGAPLVPATVTLGLGNGLFVVGAIGSMMRLASQRAGATGTRMGVFGAAQAIAAGLAGLLATGMLDLLRLALPDATAYGALFTLEAALFIAAALVAARILAGRAPAAIPGE
ncbi:MFS transporter [Jannaschia aquimarina]|uniref:PUCC protein n=1 Tax=Jannaschia aquimarina TaxID=935700 RepID=A0A0D1EAY5_9RHOB|nr:MFS transporter [Jannaschia aquimarina]KIT14894.1 PUCC protein [Jannaschia aquimarina]SNS58650.1 MFS transporter, BCD family, chlorophyll transporter [Jannaschia aquimarina]